MKKHILDLTVASAEHLREGYVLLKLTDVNPLPEMLPGQFAELKVEGSEVTFLRRPISINFVDKEKNVEKNLSEAIQVLANNAALRKRMGAHGMERSKLFSKENFYMNFVDIIRNVVHFGGGRS